MPSTQPVPTSAKRLLASSARSLPAALLLAALWACAPSGPPAEPPPGEGEPAWQEGLPEKELGPPAADAWFWAAVPEGDGVRIARVRSDDGETWRDALDRPVEVPSGLVHPMPGPPAEGDDVAVFLIAGQGFAVGAWDDGTGRVDWNGQTVEADPEPRPISAAESPLRIYSSGEESLQLGVEIARGGGKVWLTGPGGQVDSVPEDSVEIPEIRRSWQVGEAVTVFSWARGPRPGEIAGEVEPGLRFEVAFADDEREAVFFDRLAPSR